MRRSPAAHAAVHCRGLCRQSWLFLRGPHQLACVPGRLQSRGVSPGQALLPQLLAAPVSSALPAFLNAGGETGDLDDIMGGAGRPRSICICPTLTDLPPGCGRQLAAVGAWALDGQLRLQALPRMRSLQPAPSNFRVTLCCPGLQVVRPGGWLTSRKAAGSPAPAGVALARVKQSAGAQAARPSRQR